MDSGGRHIKATRLGTCSAGSAARIGEVGAMEPKERWQRVLISLQPGDEINDVHEVRVLGGDGHGAVELL